jgi:hypothetical protein
MKLIVFILVGLLTISSCQGQNQSKNISATQGATVAALDTSIFIVYQAVNGDYWFGSDGAGVYHYNGKTITHFSTKDGLSDDRVRQIVENKQGDIFINTSGGINRFDGKGITALKAVKGAWKLAPEDLWFSSNQDENGAYRYDGKTLYHLEFPKHYMHDAFYKDLPNAPYNPYQVYKTYKDSKGNIWFGTSTFGACRYDGKHLSWLYERHLTHIGDQGSFGIRSIQEDRDGAFWICNTRYRYNILPGDSIGNGTRFVRYRREEGIDNFTAPDGNDLIYYMSAVKDDEGNLWMATHRFGVWKYDGKTMEDYPVNAGKKNVTVFSIYKDRNGGIWLGTHATGAYKFNGKSFEPFKPLR